MANSSFDFRYLSIAIDIVSARLGCNKAAALEWIVTALAAEAATAKRRAMAAVLARCDEARARVLPIARAKDGPNGDDLVHGVLVRFCERARDCTGPFTENEFDHGMALLFTSIRNAHLDEVDRRSRWAPEQDPPAGGGRSGESGNPVFRSAALEQVRRLLPRFRRALLRSLTPAEAETFVALEDSARLFDHAASPVERWVFCHEFLNHTATKRGAACPHALVKEDLVVRLHQLPNSVDLRVYRLKTKWRRAQEEVFS
jgi:DNA-directed RNA polymerase specialized sigma24 family protein